MVGLTSEIVFFKDYDHVVRQTDIRHHHVADFRREVKDVNNPTIRKTDFGGMWINHQELRVLSDIEGHFKASGVWIDGWNDKTDKKDLQ